MAKVSLSQTRLTDEEWQALPVTIDAKTVARASGTCTRYVQDHPQEFGGVKVASKWCFSKTKVASLLGIGAVMA